MGKHPITASYYQSTNPHGNYLYVTNRDNTISVIDTEIPNIFPVGTIKISAFTNLLKTDDHQCRDGSKSQE